ncbi:MAG: DUF1573 domain-containing protein [Alistipes sp.]|jgi:hypothetical protein|nr:DUF1573 domain-containing protein [Alistipes sp.]
MKALAYIATLLLLCTSCGARAPKADKNATMGSAVNTQTIAITADDVEQGVADTLRFGKMRSGEIIAKTLRVENRCNRPIVLLRHTTTCGCIKINYDRKPIAPGQSGEIYFEFDSRTLYGWQMKLMEFYFAEKGNPMKIYAEAEVE